MIIFVFVESQIYISNGAEIKPNFSFTSQEERDLYQFITRILTEKSGGIITNYSGRAAKGDLPGGHEILSESVGLMMQYAVESDNPLLFEEQYQFLNKNFMLQEQFIVWKITKNQHLKAKANSLIDDLRIIHCLIQGHQKWPKKNYLTTALEIANSIKKYNSQNGWLVDYYDFSTYQAGPYLTLSYLDLATLKQLSYYDPDWLLYYHQAVKLFNSKNLASFGRKRFHILKHKFEIGQTINMIDLGITLEHLVDDGQIPKQALEWIKTVFLRERALVNDYSTVTWKGVTKEESPAVYALFCRLFYKIHDQATAEKLYQRMLSLRVLRHQSHFYGGYINLQTKECFSFDNLQALISIRSWYNHN